LITEAGQADDIIATGAPISCGVARGRSASELAAARCSQLGLATPSAAGAVRTCLLISKK